MGKRSVWVATVLVVALALPAEAASPHFKRNGIPKCTDTGSLLVCTGTLAGLGNQNLVLELKADALATFNCGAPGNGNLAAGQNKVPFTATGQQTIPGGAIKNGNATFQVSAPTGVPNPTPKQAGCPNNNWQVLQAIDIEFAKVVLTISQNPIGLLFTCRFNDPVPNDGTVQLTCEKEF